MKALSDIILPADLKYTDEHIWAKVDGAEIILGVSDFAQDQLGEIVFVDLPAVGDTFKAGAGFGTVESIKSVNTLYMPVNGGSSGREHRTRRRAHYRQRRLLLQGLDDPHQGR